MAPATTCARETTLLTHSERMESRKEPVQGEVDISMVHAGRPRLDVVRSRRWRSTTSREPGRPSYHTFALSPSSTTMFTGIVEAVGSKCPSANATSSGANADLTVSRHPP